MAELEALGGKGVPEYSEADFKPGGRFDDVGQEIDRLTSAGFVSAGGESAAVADVKAAGEEASVVVSPPTGEGPRFLSPLQGMPGGEARGADIAAAGSPARPLTPEPANLLSGEEESRVRQQETDFYRDDADKRISAFQQGNLHVESLTSFLPWDLVFSRYEAGSQELNDAFTRVRNVLTPEEFERVQGLFYENIASLINGMELPSILRIGGRMHLLGDAGWLDQYRRDIIAHPGRGIEIINNDEEWNKWVANPVQQTRPEAAAVDTAAAESSESSQSFNDDWPSPDEDGPSTSTSSATAILTPEVKTAVGEGSGGDIPPAPARLIDRETGLPLLSLRDIKTNYGSRDYILGGGISVMAFFGQVEAPGFDPNVWYVLKRPGDYSNAGEMQIQARIITHLMKQGVERAVKLVALPAENEKETFLLEEYVQGYSPPDGQGYLDMENKKDAYLKKEPTPEELEARYAKIPGLFEQALKFLPLDGSPVPQSDTERTLRARWCWGVLEAVAEIHRAGVVITDAKSYDAILIPDKNIVKIIDFGNGGVEGNQNASLSYYGKDRDINLFFGMIAEKGFGFPVLSGAASGADIDNWIGAIRQKALDPIFLDVSEKIANSMKSNEVVYKDGQELMEALRPLFVRLGVGQTSIPFAPSQAAIGENRGIPLTEQESAEVIRQRDEVVGDGAAPDSGVPQPEALPQEAADLLDSGALVSPAKKFGLPGWVPRFGRPKSAVVEPAAEVPNESELTEEEREKLQEEFDGALDILQSRAKIDPERIAVVERVAYLIDVLKQNPEVGMARDILDALDGPDFKKTYDELKQRLERKLRGK